MTPIDRLELGKKIIEGIEHERRDKLDVMAKGQILSVVDDVLREWAARQVNLNNKWDRRGPLAEVPQ